MKKLFLVFLLFLIVSTPLLASADSFLPLVRCGNSSGQYTTACTLADFFQMLLRIYKFMVYIIALPLAGILIVIGGILILLSGGPGASNPVTGIVSPNLYSTGKNMIIGAVVGLALIFGSWLIINTVLYAIGYQLRWNII